MDSDAFHHGLLALFRLHRRHAGKCFCDSGLTRGQPPVLRHLLAHDGCIQRELAQDGHLEPASISAVLLGMERQGLIRREPDQADRRILRVFITRKGRAAIQGVEEELEALDRRMLEGFSPEEEARPGNTCAGCTRT